jgi:predicted PurR-regulated permease PerM
MNRVIQLPFYAKLVILIVGILAFVVILKMAQSIIIPLVFSVIVAILLHPVVLFLTRIKINRVVAIGITLMLVTVVMAIFGMVIFSQANRMGESWPKLVEKFTEILNNTIIWITAHFDISSRNVVDRISLFKEELINGSPTTIGKTIVSVTSGVMTLFIIPVYIFMVLYYQPLLIEFFKRLFGAKNRLGVSEVITQIKTLIRSYLVGLLIETAIIATLYSIGLLFLGIEYAIIFGIIGAFLNLIPYLGSILAAILPMIIAIASKPSPWYALLVLALFVFIQFIDNNFIVPKIVASKVRINALVSITTVLAFATLWGIPGMLLAIPLTAIAKLIFDHVDSLKPWGLLFGDVMPGNEQTEIIKIGLIEESPLDQSKGSLNP